MAENEKARDRTEAEAPAEADAPAQRTIARFTENYGGLVERRFTKADLAAVNVKVEKDLIFDKSNRFSVDVTDLGEDVLEVLKEQPDITLKTSSA